MTDRCWSELVWLTGLIDRARFDTVCDALERERQTRQRITDVSAAGGAMRIAS